MEPHLTATGCHLPYMGSQSVTCLQFFLLPFFPSGLYLSTILPLTVPQTLLVFPSYNFNLQNIQK